MRGDYESDESLLTVLDTAISRLEIKENSNALEIGCGSGLVTRRMLSWPGVGSVIGIDLDTEAIQKAKDWSKGVTRIDFAVGDACQLSFRACAFDLVVFNCTLAHIENIEKAIHEAYRITTPGGQIVILDADYAAFHISNSSYDPLEALIRKSVSIIAPDPWYIRYLPTKIAKAGFDIEQSDVFTYSAHRDSTLLMTIYEKGVESAYQSGHIGRVLAEALIGELTRRLAIGDFHGSLPLHWFVGRKPQADLGAGI